MFFIGEYKLLERIFKRKIPYQLLDKGSLNYIRIDYSSVAFVSSEPLAASFL